MTQTEIVEYLLNNIDRVTRFKNGNELEQWLQETIEREDIDLEVRVRAGRLLMARDGMGDRLHFIMFYVEPLRQEAWGKFVAFLTDPEIWRDDLTDHLRWIVRCVPSLRRQAWEYLKGRNPRWYDLIEDIRSAPELKREAEVLINAQKELGQEVFFPEWW